jgi:hypothetical protein
LRRIVWLPGAQKVTMSKALLVVIPATENSFSQISITHLHHVSRTSPKTLYSKYVLGLQGKQHYDKSLFALRLLMQGHHNLSELENYTVKGAHHSNLGNLVMFIRVHTAFPIPSVIISKAETPLLF